MRTVQKGWLARNWFWLIILVCVLHGAFVLKGYFKSYPADQLSQKIVVTGEIVSLPEMKPESVNFLFQTRDGLVRLSWYERFSKVPMPHFVPGDLWRFTVKLKKPRGYQNPGVFDYGQFLRQQGIQATGYIDSRAKTQNLGSEAYTVPIEWIRFKIREAVMQTVEHPQVLGVINALLLGDKSGLTLADKQLFQKTGTSHLMAISGLHIGLIALWFFCISKFLWSLFPILNRRASARKVAIYVSLLAALLYALLAGFSLPTQRAFIMIAVAGFSMLAMKRLTVKRIWLIAFLLVMLWNPFSIISAGFWLSFLAVAFLLLAFSGRIGALSVLHKWLYPQVVVLIALIPATVYWFGYFSPFSLLANIVAIPLVSFVIVPVIFLATLLLFLGANIFALLGVIITLFLGFLQFVAAYAIQFAYLGGMDLIAMVLAILGLFILFFPRGVPGKWLGLALMFPMVFYRPSLPDGVYARLYLLDVGQGLAVVFQSQGETLIYDTGPVFSSGNDAGEFVLIPFLKSIGVRSIDEMVISHGDSDHIGGLKSVAQQFKIKHLYASTSVGQSAPSVERSNCHEAQSWQWGNIHFEFLNPANPKEVSRRRNDSSCVLKITLEQQSILLPGDIEKPMEYYLMDYHYGQLASTIIVAPHHGSNSSSMAGFIRAVDPEYVLYATGFENRYHHPATKVQRRYYNQGILSYNTAYDGAIWFDFYSNGDMKATTWLKN